MIYLILAPLRTDYSALNVLRYPLFRSALALLTALAVCLLVGPWVIRWLKSVKAGQHIRTDGPRSHLDKKGTPTMGGSLMILGILIGVLLWGDLRNEYIILALLLLLAFGCVGFMDDYAKLKQQGTRGLSGRTRLGIEFLIASVVMFSLVVGFNHDTTLSMPFLSVMKFNPDIGVISSMIFGSFLVVGTSNAVNLTDGLDGLAIGPIIVSASTFLGLCYAAGAVIGGLNIADYLRIPHSEGIEEMCIFCSAIVGSGIGFLWFNAYPAQIFMGDTGSLALGASLGLLSVITKHEFLSAIIHGVFLVEVLSVILQVAYFKISGGKRIFRMAPLHHHFELSGWPESKVTIRFWIFSIMLSVFSLATLKLR